MTIVAYILINVKVGKLRETIEKIKNTPGVVSVAITAGIYDLVVRVEVPNLEALFNLTEKIHSIDGIERTNTHIVEYEIP